MTTRYLTSGLRQPFRYPGSKTGLMSNIRDHLPDHNTYIGPFGGCAGDFLAKKPSKNEIYGDIDPLLVNFWRVLTNQTEELISAVKRLRYSREQLYHSVDILRSTKDPLEMATHFTVIYNQSLPQSANKWQKYYPTWCNDHRKTGEPQPSRWAKIARTLTAVRRRMCVVDFHQGDWRQLLSRDRDDVLWFFDPPYDLPQETNQDIHYNYYFLTKDHRNLLLGIGHLRGKVILCGYPSVFYDRLLPKTWHQYSYQKNLQIASYHGTTRKVDERLWTNFKFSPSCEFLTSLGQLRS